MAREHRFLPCALLVLSPVAFASDGKVASVPETSKGEADRASEGGLPALFSWADVDGDGRLDLAAVGSEGALQLLVGNDNGNFEDVTERAGLAEVGNAALALWADYDADGRLDLFVGARSGASRLFHNDGGRFTDMSAGSGLESTGAVQSAQWLDHDGDGRLDLFVVTAEGSEHRSTLFRGLEGGFFERSELPARAGAGVGSVPGGPIVVGQPLAPSPSEAPLENGQRGRASTEGSTVVSAAASRAPIVTAPGRGSASATPLGIVSDCLPSIRDQASPLACLQASSSPTLGKLYPLSSNLFVAVGGDVGIGTTSPQKKLHVAGSALVVGTLTLDSGDRALEFPGTSSIYHAGTRFIHTRGGVNNTAIGRQALAHVTTGQRNTASGFRALYLNTTGARNTATGSGALYSNTSGTSNTATGNLALYSNTDGADNTATGYRALYANTTGKLNTASGERALFSNTTGSFNSAHGANALYSNTTGIRNNACGVAALSSNSTGSNNTACGERALDANTTGGFGTAVGQQALSANTTGAFNTAAGARALYTNTTGNRNTALGYAVLRYTTVGTRNTASGFTAMRYNTSGSYNTASGDRALLNNSTGSRNIGLGREAGRDLTTGSDNIAIGNVGVAGEAATIRLGTAGTHTRAFVAGIRGVTTANANAIPVLVDSAGQLGTVSSSRRFKEDIRDMGDATERLLELRPVLFRYKQEQTLPNAQELPPEYGLIAEEVAEIFPDLVVYDEAGQPFTVKYHLLSSMLLNEMKKQAGNMVELREELERLRVELTRLRGLEARLDAVEAR